MTARSAAKIFGYRCLPQRGPPKLQFVDQHVLTVAARHVAPREAPRCGRQFLTFLNVDRRASRGAKDIVLCIPATAGSRLAWMVFEVDHCLR
jgi:hypothetical protein